MVIKLNSGQECNISFTNNLSKFTNWSNRDLFVEWFKNDEFYGSMNIPSNTWGGMPFENIDVWQIKTNDGFSYTNFINNKSVLINAILESENALSLLEEYCKAIKLKYNCNIYVYIKDSHLLNLKSKFYQTLKLNYPIEEMALGLNKKF